MIVCKRTWDGLVAELGYPEFIDGRLVSSPNVAILTKDGLELKKNPPFEPVTTTVSDEDKELMILKKGEGLHC